MGASRAAARARANHHGSRAARGTAGDAQHRAESPLRDVRPQRTTNRRRDATVHHARRSREAPPCARTVAGRQYREAIMSQDLGRATDAGVWPRTKPVWTLGLLLIAVLSALAIGAHDYVDVWTPLERAYLSAYIRSQCATTVWFSRDNYHLLYVIERNRERLATNEDVQPITTENGEASLALSEPAIRAGAKHLTWTLARHAHAAVHGFLKVGIYDKRSLADLAAPAVRGAVMVLLVGLFVAVPRDLGRARARRHGRRLKGPELVTAARFNRSLRADGVGFVQTPRLLARLCGWRSWVRIPRRLESSHVLIMGDSGTGKSSLIRQVLQQLDARGDTAIVYDPALEYLPQFYRPERGDVILNPLDARCPYWSPGDELRHDA